MKRVPSSDLSPDSDCNDGVYYHDGEPYTGVSFGVDSEGHLRWEAEYKHGLEWGQSRGWFPSGALARESELLRGALHGHKREWLENGQLVREEEWELGVCLRRRLWDEHGQLVEDFALQSTDPMFDMLRALREWARNADQAEAEKS